MNTERIYELRGKVLVNTERIYELRGTVLVNTERIYEFRGTVLYKPFNERGNESERNNDRNSLKPLAFLSFTKKIFMQPIPENS